MSGIGNVGPEVLAESDSQEFAEEQEVHEEGKSFIGDPIEPEEGEDEEDEDKEEDEEREEEEEVEDEPEEAGEKLAAKPRTQRRIRSLIERRKAVEKERDQFRQELEAIRAQNTQVSRQRDEWSKSLQEQQQELQTQLAVAKKELELMRQGYEATEEANLDPTERFRRQLKKEAIAEAQSQLMPEIEQLRKWRDDFQSQQKKQQEDAATQERINGYMRDSDSASLELLNGIDETKAKPLSKRLSALVLNHAAAFNMTPKDAAKDLDRLVMQYASAKMKVKSKQNGEKVKKSQKVPQPAPSARVSAKGKARPSWSEVKKAGFDDMLDYMSAQGG